jgi:hypothetical protein
MIFLFCPIPKAFGKRKNQENRMLPPANPELARPIFGAARLVVRKILLMI